MKKVIAKLHPNIFAWIEFIQREEAVTKPRFRASGLELWARPRRHRMKEEKKRMQTFLTASSTLLDFS